MGEREVKVILPPAALRARLRRLLRNAGYELAAVVLKRTDGAELTPYDTRGVPALVHGWATDEKARATGEKRETARAGVARIVEEPAPSGRAKTKTVAARATVKKRAAAKRRPASRR